MGSISSEKSTSKSGAPEIAFATVSAIVVKVGKTAAASSSIPNGFCVNGYVNIINFVSGELATMFKTHAALH